MIDKNVVVRSVSQRGARDADHIIGILGFLGSALLHVLIIAMLWVEGGQQGGEIPAQSSGGTDLIVQYIAVEQGPAVEQATADDIATQPANEQDAVTPPASTEPAVSPPNQTAMTETAASNEHSAESELAAAAGSASAAGSVDVVDDVVEARYVAALKAAIIAQWRSTTENGATGKCRLTLQQLPGGAVVAVQPVDCDLSSSERRALETAALRAQPLPYAGFEAVFHESRVVEIELR